MAFMRKGENMTDQKHYPMPALTEHDREDLRDYLTGERVFYKREEDKLDDIRDAITLAALTAKPVGEVVDACGQRSVEWDVGISEGEQIYTAPPVPALKPVDLYHAEYATLDDGFYLKRDDVFNAILAAGCEVKDAE